MAFFELRTDGGARGNPGPAALGFVLTDPAGEVIASEGRFLGTATNNVAEYEAVIAGLEAAAASGITEVRVLSDSELVVRQLEGTYRVKNEGLRPLYTRTVQLLDGFMATEVVHVRREQNVAADALVNEALDAYLGTGPSGCEDAEAPVTIQTGGVWELTVKGHFDAAHELVGYPGQCRELHGHTWDVEVTVVGSALDEVGIVYDFTRLKQDLKSVLDPYDHAHLNEVPPFDEINPTAENLARVICGKLQACVEEQVQVVEVAVWESPIAKIVFRPE